MCARLPVLESQSRAVTFLSTVKVHHEFRHGWALGNNHDSASVKTWLGPWQQSWFCLCHVTCLKLAEKQSLKQAQLILVHSVILIGLHPRFMKKAAWRTNILLSETYRINSPTTVFTACLFLFSLCNEWLLGSWAFGFLPFVSFLLIS